MVKNTTQRVVEIEVEQFSEKGNGVGYFLKGDGKKAYAEVPFAIPGDKVKGLLLRKRGKVYTSRLQEMVVNSPDRIVPRCIHFGSCGGCRWQQISYERQLKEKEQFVKHCFAGHEVLPIVPCDPPWQYRNKMEYTFSNDAAGKKYLGLVMDSSRGKVLSLSECHLVNPWFMEGLKAVRSWWGETDLSAYHPMRNSGSLRTLTLREGIRTGDRMAILTVSGNPDYALKKHHLESFTAFMRDAVEPLQSLSLFLRIQQIGKGMPTNFYEMLLYGPDHIREELQMAGVTLSFKISPAAFFQPNTRQAEKLYSLALQQLEIPEGSVVYDLYCGTGTLGICASKLAKKVIGIEISPESSLDARANVAANGCENVEILTGSVPELLAKGELPHPDIVMLDPPRMGLDPTTLKQILALSPSKILYISCNPLTQAANILELVQAGYKLALIQPVDQFPQTPHIENIAILIR